MRHIDQILKVRKQNRILIVESFKLKRLILMVVIMRLTKKNQMMTMSLMIFKCRRIQKKKEIELFMATIILF